MADLNNKNSCPTLAEIEKFVKNPVFEQFCSEIKRTYNCNEKIEFSACSWAPGWNDKFKKAGKTLCTIYPKENFVTVMVVIGRQAKEPVEAILPELTPELKDIYHHTQAGNGQKWLMIDLQAKGDLYNDLLRLIEIRRNC